MKILKRLWLVVSVIAVLIVAALGWFKFGEPWLKKKRTLESIRGMQNDRVEIEVLNEHLITFLQRHKECAGERDVVVFVHGYGGHPIKTWGETFQGLNRAPYENPDLSWLQCLDAISLSYPTGLAQGSSIDGAASRLKELLDRHVMSKGYERVYLIAHSMGGLVVQRALLDLLLQGDARARTVDLPKIKAIAYFDTPHDDLALRDPQAAVSWFAELEGETDEMAADSEFRKKLRRDWERAFEAEPAITRRVFVERAWIFEADETAQILVVVQGLKYRNFRDPKTDRMAIAQTLPGTSHTSICKSTADELVQGKGYFHDRLVSLLGRHETISNLGREPWGLSRSEDGRWIYVTTQDEETSSVRRIGVADNKVDREWLATVGSGVHDFLEVDTGSGRIGIATDMGPTEEREDNGIALVDLDSGQLLDRVGLGGRPDDLDVYGSLVAISDADDGRIWIFDAARRRIVSETALRASGKVLEVRGVHFIRGGRQLLACADRGYGSEIAFVLLLEVRPDGRLRELSRVRTGKTPAEVRYLESAGLACAASHDTPGAVVCHSLGERSLGEAQRIVFSAKAKPSALAVASSGGAESLYVAGFDGAARRLEWQDGAPRVSVYEHGGENSWALETDATGSKIYITNGASGTVVVLDAASQQWVLSAEG